MAEVNIPQSPIVDLRTGYLRQEWLLWLLNPQVQTIIIGTPLDVEDGGTGISSGTSGGVLTFTASDVIASSGELVVNRLVLGGGAGDVPFTLNTLGTSTTVLHGNAGGAPTFGAVDLTTDITGTLQVANGGTGAVTLTANGVLVGSGTGPVSVTSVGTAGQVLTSNGLGMDPTFQNASGAPDPSDAHWEPVSNMNPSAPELLFDAVSGDVTMGWVS